MISLSVSLQYRRSLLDNLLTSLISVTFQPAAFIISGYDQKTENENSLTCCFDSGNNDHVGAASSQQIFAFKLTSKSHEDGYNKGYSDAVCDSNNCHGHGYDPSCSGGHTDVFSSGYSSGYQAGWSGGSGRDQFSGNTNSHNNNNNNQQGAGNSIAGRYAKGYELGKENGKNAYQSGNQHDNSCPIGFWNNISYCSGYKIGYEAG